MILAVADGDHGPHLADTRAGDLRQGDLASAGHVGRLEQVKEAFFEGLHGAWGADSTGSDPPELVAAKPLIITRPGGRNLKSHAPQAPVSLP